MKKLRNPFLQLILVLVLLGPATPRAERVIIRSAKPYYKIVQTIQKAGGQVSYQYRYINAVAADVPEQALQSIQKLLPLGSVQKDLISDLPRPARDPGGNPLIAEGQADSSESLDAAGLAALADFAPNAYLFNNTMMNLDAVHANGYYGQGMKVAVIDTGIRPFFPNLNLDGSVIGGEDLVGDGMGYSNNLNDGHGTFVGGMISANVVFRFPTNSSFLAAVQSYCPSCVLPGPAPYMSIPMIGSAPLSSIYALRIIPPGSGTPMSRMLAAMERVVTLRDNYDHGMPETKNPDGSYSALNIKVCNMSVGGATTYPGRSVLDEMTQVVLDHDILLSISAGNAGPSGTTGGSPGSGFGSLTVGAASTATHERILRDLQYGSGVGLLFRPFDGTETAYFSSRGPTADGRTSPDLVANGMASFGQGFASSASGISIASGTSFSSPSVAGVAAILRQAVPGATARQIRNALIMTANPSLLEDGSGKFDRGAGYVDGKAALDLLKTGQVPDTPGIEGLTNVDVKVNYKLGAKIKTYSGKVDTRHVTDLLPGQRFETYYSVTPNTAAVVVTVLDVIPGSPQNAFFGDDVLLTVHSSKYTAIGEGDYIFSQYTTGGEFIINKPEPGVMRITLTGDWTNASPLALAKVNIYSWNETTSGKTSKGPIANGDVFAFAFKIPAGATKLNAQLEWGWNWAMYPVNDIDLYLINPNGELIITGATLNSPEKVEISDPPPGDWTAIIYGYEVHNADTYKLRILVDDEIIH